MPAFRLRQSGSRRSMAVAAAAAGPEEPLLRVDRAGMVDRTDDDVAAGRQDGGNDGSDGEASNPAAMEARTAPPHHRCRRSIGGNHKAGVQRLPPPPPPPQPDPSPPRCGLTGQEWSTGPMTTSPQAERTAKTRRRARWRILRV